MSHIKLNIGGFSEDKCTVEISDATIDMAEEELIVYLAEVRGKRKNNSQERYLVAKLLEDLNKLTRPKTELDSFCIFNLISLIIKSILTA